MRSFLLDCWALWLPVFLLRSTLLAAHNSTEHAGSSRSSRARARARCLRSLYALRKPAMLMATFLMMMMVVVVVVMIGPFAPPSRGDAGGGREGEPEGAPVQGDAEEARGVE